jgi:hypothetical protein
MVNNDGSLRALSASSPAFSAPHGGAAYAASDIVGHLGRSRTKPGRCKAFADSEKSPVEHIVASKILAPVRVAREVTPAAIKSPLSVPRPVKGARCELGAKSPTPTYSPCSPVILDCRCGNRVAFR